MGFQLSRVIGVSNLDWSQWLYGLVAGFIGGGSTAVVSGVTINLVDPEHFNAKTSGFYKLVGAIFLANGIMSGFMYLKQNPLPVIKTTTTLQKTETGGQPPVTVTATKIERIEPILPDKPGE